MPSLTVTTGLNLTGAPNGTYSQTITSTGIVQKIVSVPAAESGTLSTRSSSTAGTLTLSGTTFTSGNIIDIYWANGSVTSATVGSVSGSSVPFTGATGTLPVVNTAVVACLQLSEAFSVIGNNIVALVASCLVPFTTVFLTSVPAVLLTVGGTGPPGVPPVQNQNYQYQWYTGIGFTNPLASDTVATISLSQSLATGPSNVNVTALYNS